MIVARSGYQLRRAIDSLSLKRTHGPVEDILRERPRVALIPTMGALHEGHLSLVAAAGRASEITVASVFVNPTQFAPGEDFDRYPRTEAEDLELLEKAGTDIAFLPSLDDVYPPDFTTQILADRNLTGCLCGQSRGHEHFDGVVTVVARLFGLVRPDSAWFGEKDWQQLQVIRSMTKDILPGIEICQGPTVRDSDGLALSSRNAMLGAEGRAKAGAIPSVNAAITAAAAADPTLTGEEISRRAVELFETEGIAVDYAEVRESQSLTLLGGPANSVNSPRLFVAVTVEGVRLIDNVPIFSPKSPTTHQAVTADFAASTT